MIYDLFDYDNYSKPNTIFKHKKSIVSHHAGFLKVENDPIVDRVSSGILIKFTDLLPNHPYKLSVEAELVSGDQAFVFIESATTRLVPRTWLFDLNKLQRYEILFQLDKAEDIRIGVLFCDKGMKYIIHITEFNIS
jgi:hypothetical protein